MTTACETETFAKDKPPVVSQPAGSAFRIEVGSPVSSRITANVSLPDDAAVTLTIFDVSGRMVGRPYRFPHLSRGDHMLEIPASQLKSGAYLVLCEGAGSRQMVKVVKVK
jgi:hypothetical protein